MRTVQQVNSSFTLSPEEIKKMYDKSNDTKYSIGKRVCFRKMALYGNLLLQGFITYEQFYVHMNDALVRHNFSYTHLENEQSQSTRYCVVRNRLKEKLRQKQNL